MQRSCLVSHHGLLSPEELHVSWHRVDLRMSPRREPEPAMASLQRVWQGQGRGLLSVEGVYTCVGGHYSQRASVAAGSRQQAGRRSNQTAPRGPGVCHYYVGAQGKCCCGMENRLHGTCVRAWMASRWWNGPSMNAGSAGLVPGAMHTAAATSTVVVVDRRALCGNNTALCPMGGCACVVRTNGCYQSQQEPNPPPFARGAHDFATSPC